MSDKGNQLIVPEEVLMNKIYIVESTPKSLVSVREDTNRGEN